jgi:hypothetical protein
VTQLDLSDPMVREMADRNHRPEERWTLGGTLAGVTCSECYKTWPCPTRLALRQVCSCPDIDTSMPGERPYTSSVKGLDPHCPVHGRPA